MEFLAVIGASKIQVIKIKAGSSVIEQLADGQLVKFNCESASRPISQATECRATMTLTLPGYIGHQATQEIAVVGDSQISKLDAISNLRVNCIKTLNNTVSNVEQACNSLSDGVEITCKSIQ